MATVVPEQTMTPAPADPALRLVPALVHGQRVYVECPSWCESDHVAENERHLEDIAHAGAMTDLVVPGDGPGYQLLVHARLGADLFAPRVEDRVPFVIIDDGAEGFQLTPREADVFADRLLAFAMSVRALGRAAGVSA
jgi:hypothetical protein